MIKKIFWLAGEHSGDLHSSLVIRAMQKQYPHLYHYGVGGENMVKAGFQPLYPFQKFCVMGFLEVAKQATFFLKIEREIIYLLSNDQPDLVVLVDYPGLNMRIAEKVARLGVKVLYFISPQIWAWKHHRIHQLKKYCKHVCYILPFEKSYFEQEKIPATYVGHPIAEEIGSKMTKTEFAEKYSLSPDKKWLGFFPGSRISEIKKLMPVYLNTISKLNSDQYQFLISQATSIRDSEFQHFHFPASVKVIKTDNYEMMKHCDFLVVKSGTTTLECAFMGTPFLIVYKTSLTSYEIGKRIVHIKRIGLPNIILDDDAIPELVQHDANPTNIAKHVKLYLENAELYQEMKAKLNQLQALLGSKKTSEEVTKIIVGLLNE
jgi:lipid-A-disaccharide synthase